MSVEGGGSAANRADPILLAHVTTSELSEAHVLHALLCFRPTGTCMLLILAFLQQ